MKELETPSGLACSEWQEHFNHWLGWRTYSTQRIWTPSEARQTTGPNSATGCSLPLHLGSKSCRWKQPAGLFCVPYVSSQEISFEKKNFKNYPIWMKNGIKRTMMVLKHLHKFDTPPINRESLISLPMNRGYLGGLLSMNRMRPECYCVNSKVRS